MAVAPWKSIPAALSAVQRLTILTVHPQNVRFQNVQNVRVTKRQVYITSGLQNVRSSKRSVSSKRQVSKRQVYLRNVRFIKCQVYKTYDLQNVRFQNERLLKSNFSFYVLFFLWVKGSRRNKEEWWNNKKVWSRMPQRFFFYFSAISPEKLLSYNIENFSGCYI